MKELFGKVTEMAMENSIVKEIVDIHRQFSERDLEDWTPDELSKEAGKLSVLLVNLGGMVVKTRSIADFAEDTIGTDVAQEIVESVGKGTAVTRAEVEAKARSAESKKQVALYKHKSNFLQQLYRDTERFVSVIQSRLKTLSSGPGTGISIG